MSLPIRNDLLGPFGTDSLCARPRRYFRDAFSRVAAVAFLACSLRIKTDRKRRKRRIVNFATCACTREADLLAFFGETILSARIT